LKILILNEVKANLMKKFRPFILGFLFITMTLQYAAGQKADQELNTFIDNWHKAAAEADAKTFFGSMAENSIYIGTDATERWNKTEFFKYAKPYFDRGKAWTFKAYDRDLHVTSDGSFAWFSELLTTRFGVCRGSGMIRKTGQGWQIEQYHLSVTVPNDLINDFISLVDNFNKQKK
jgi:hypothetical protein